MFGFGFGFDWLDDDGGVLADSGGFGGDDDVSVWVVGGIVRRGGMWDVGRGGSSVTRTRTLTLFSR